MTPADEKAIADPASQSMSVEYQLANDFVDRPTVFVERSVRRYSTLHQHQSQQMSYPLALVVGYRSAPEQVRIT
jgi:hypothetical protein